MAPPHPRTPLPPGRPGPVLYAALADQTARRAAERVAGIVATFTAAFAAAFAAAATDAAEPIRRTLAEAPLNRHTNGTPPPEFRHGFRQADNTGWC